MFVLGAKSRAMLVAVPSTHVRSTSPPSDSNPPPFPNPAFPMSTTNQTTDLSSANFTAIFHAASNEYKTLTKEDLETHPFAAAIENSPSPDAVVNIFRKEAQAFDEFRNGDKRLMGCLTPIVNFLFIFSGTLGGGIGKAFPPATIIFTGIGVLLGVARNIIASYEALVVLFERIQFFFQRLDRYTSVPLTLPVEMKELLAKIMAQNLYILALSTKTMKQSRIKKYMNRIIGKNDVENAFQRLSMLIEEENLMAGAMTFEATQCAKDDLNTVQEQIKEGFNATEGRIDDLHLKQSRIELRQWLAPPDPSVNHNTACNIQHDGTAGWFIHGSTFNEWKTNGTLLWIHGIPGSGKTILCSAIIKEIKHIQKSRSALVAYYYFDDDEGIKRDLGGLLTSLLLQLVDDSVPCWDLLSQLHKTYHYGSEQPSEAALTQCLKDMLDSLDQIPTYIIIDAIDECPNTETPSAREKVLNFVKNLARSNHSNLFICVTSRSGEQDINTILEPLAQSHRVSLHEEVDQTEDIKLFVRSFVMNDRTMRRWRAEDKDLVILELSERAEGMFRWVYCQLDSLRRRMSPNIREVLKELPTTLASTYEEILKDIPTERFHHARRLFQCIAAAIRPLRVEELAEIFAIEFSPNEVAKLVDSYRPVDPEEAVLSACSSLIAIINVGGFKSVYFSHSSVKEYMTSCHLLTSDIISDYHITLELAHTVLARACIAVLLQLDENVDKERVATFPLAEYASKHWLDHAKFENVQSQIQDALKHLFDPIRSHLRACIWMHDVEVKYNIHQLGHSTAQQPPPLPATPLYYAVFCGFTGLTRWLIEERAEDVNAKCYYDRTPLHVASQEGHVDAVRLLIHHGANVNAQELVKWMPLHMASYRGNLEVVQLLLKHDATLNAQTYFEDSPVYLASQSGHLEVVRLLCKHGVDVHIRGSDDLTPFQVATQRGHHGVAQLLLGYGAENE